MQALKIYIPFFTSVGGARIYAKYVRPMNAAAPHPVILEFHGYTGNSGDWADKLRFSGDGTVIAAIWTAVAKAGDVRIQEEQPAPPTDTLFEGFPTGLKSFYSAASFWRAFHSRDVARYWEELNKGYDCVFGSRFMRGGGVIDYPRIKLAINRLANFFVRMMFRHGLNDTTNAFKAYRKSVIDGVRTIISPHFNITVELPLKAIVRGYSFTVIPITWRNRRHGVAKLKIKEMGSRYLFICLYVWFEKYFSRGDYKKAKAKFE